MFSQPCPGGCTPIISLDSFFLWFHPVACKPYGQQVPCCHVCPVGYLFLFLLAGIACCSAPLWCAMDRNHHAAPLIWIIHKFCRWVHLLASQLFHMLYFPINPVFFAWPGHLFATAKCGHLDPVGHTLFCSHIGICDVWPLFFMFPGQSCRPNAVCPPASLHSHGVPHGAVPPFVIQTGDQGLTWASIQTLHSISWIQLCCSLCIYKHGPRWEWNPSSAICHHPVVSLSCLSKWSWTICIVHSPVGGKG